MHRQLQAVARRRGQRASDVVREAVERQLDLENRTASAYERAQQAGLIGAARGEIRDLSEPKYFERFRSCV